MKNKEIAVLVRKVQKDKKSSFEELYKEIWNTVYYYCYKNLGNEHDAKDAMQTVFLQLYNKFNNLHHPKAFNKFLYTIMTYTCSNFRKSKANHDTDELEVHELSAEEVNAEFLPDEAYEREDVRVEITKMIDALPSKQREAVLLFYFEGMSIKEISEITDSKFNAVNNRLVTARKSLRKRAENLIEKGVLDQTMAILPIPILTRILLEESQRIATPEICEVAWQGISSSLEIAEIGVAAAEAVVVETATATATTAATATSGALVNICVGLICAAMLVSGGYLIYYVSDNFINPPAVVEEYPAEEYGILDFERLIQAITAKDEFIEFTNTYGFTFLGGSRLSDKGNQMLYFVEYYGKFIYVGYTECLQNIFQVVYEITDNNRSRITSEQIPEWFAARTINN